MEIRDSRSHVATDLDGRIICPHCWGVGMVLEVVAIRGNGARSALATHMANCVVDDLGPDAMENHSASLMLTCQDCRGLSYLTFLQSEGSLHSLFKVIERSVPDRHADTRVMRDSRRFVARVDDLTTGALSGLDVSPMGRLVVSQIATHIGLDPAHPLWAVENGWSLPDLTGISRRALSGHVGQLRRCGLLVRVPDEQVRQYYKPGTVVWQLKRL